MAVKEEVKTTFKPLRDRIFVEYLDDDTEKSAGGIYIPETAKEKSQKGTVRAIGPDVKLVKVGDSILCERYGGSKIKLDDVEYVVMKEEEVLGLFD